MDRAGGVQAVLDQGIAAYTQTHRLSARQVQVCAHIRAYRTPALGGLTLACDQCDYDRPQYHACWDRHCPRCQYRDSAAWCERQRESVLPVTYYHVVFTVPHALNAWVALHRRVIYRLLFQTVWATLKAFGADPKRLGGELGMTAVLHTWSQNLSQHVHLHCLIPGGALSQAGQWRSVKGNYLFPVRALSRHFRGRMVSALRTAQQQGELSRVTRPGDVDRLLDALMRTEWVVYSKACLSHTDTVVAYLARYSHRIAITDRRIVSIEDGQVRFHYKDYRDGDHKVMQLTSEEFIRRFLLHVLPKGFMRIRHYGWLANCCRQAKLERIRTSLEHRDDTEVTNTQEAPGPRTFDGYPCPKCQQGYLRVRCSIAPTHRRGGG